LVVTSRNTNEIAWNTGCNAMASSRFILALSLLFCTAFLSYGAFGSVMDAVFSDGASDFLIPLIWFSALLTVFSLGTIVWREQSLRVTGVILFLVPSLLFAPGWVHAAVIVFSCLVVFGAELRINQEIRERLRLSLYRSVWTGFSALLFALSLAVSSQFYAHARSLPWEQLVPSFDLAEGTGAWLVRSLGKVNPAVQQLQDENLSVDTFLFEVRDVRITELSEAVGRETIEGIRRAEAARSKLELSRLLGREVSGNERMQDVLSEVVRKKVVAFLSGGVERENLPVPVLPLFLAFLLFLTVYPLGTFFGPLALVVAQLAFAYFRRCGVIKTRAVTAEQECLI
jgi:hypothetical protein